MADKFDASYGVTILDYVSSPAVGSMEKLFGLLSAATTPEANIKVIPAPVAKEKFHQEFDQGIIVIYKVDWKVGPSAYGDEAIFAALKLAMGRREGLRPL